MSETPLEFRTAAIAEAALAADAAATAAVRGRELAQLASTSARVVQRPGDEPTPAMTREWALQRILQKGVVLRPGGTAKADFVLMMPDGSAVVTRQTAAPRVTVITPENADEIGKRFERERREQENALLVLHYGEDVCLEAGIIP